MDKLHDALNALKALDHDVTNGDIEDKLKAIGSFMYRELDDAIYAIEEVLDVLDDNTKYIAELERQVEEMESKVGDSK